MNCAHMTAALAVAGLISGCSSTSPSATYYPPGAPPVTVAGSSATYSAGTGTIAGGVNTLSTSDRVVVGDPANKTTTGETAAAASGAVVGGSALNPNTNAGASTSAMSNATDPQGRRPSSP